MLRRFLSFSVGALALAVVLGAPGPLHAQRFRSGMGPMVQPGLGLRPGFPGTFRPGFPGGINTRFNRGFDIRSTRSIDRLGNGFNREFFNPLRSPGFTPGFRPGFTPGFTPGFFRPF